MKHYIRVALLLASVSAAAQTTPKNEELTSLSVDDLLNVEVTSVARRGQKLSETTAATFVITQELSERVSEFWVGNVRFLTLLREWTGICRRTSTGKQLRTALPAPPSSRQ